jgi:hypothetical protein
LVEHQNAQRDQQADAAKQRHRNKSVSNSATVSAETLGKNREANAAMSRSHRTLMFGSMSVRSPLFHDDCVTTSIRFRLGHTVINHAALIWISPVKNPVAFNAALLY